MTKEMLCITCPTGCRLQAEKLPDGTINVTGNRCKRGIAFATAELTCPTRSLTTTVRTTLAGVPVLPVRTNGEIPKDSLGSAMEEIAACLLKEPLPIGGIVLRNISGSGVDLIATSNQLMEG